MMHLNVIMSSQLLYIWADILKVHEATIHLRSPPNHQQKDLMRSQMHCLQHSLIEVLQIPHKYSIKSSTRLHWGILITLVLIKGSFRSTGRHPDVQQVDEKQKGQISYRAVDISSKVCLSFRWLTSLWSFFNCSSVSYLKGSNIFWRNIGCILSLLQYGY